MEVYRRHTDLILMGQTDHLTKPPLREDGERPVLSVFEKRARLLGSRAHERDRINGAECGSCPDYRACEAPDSLHGLD